MFMPVFLRVLLHVCVHGICQPTVCVYVHVFASAYSLALGQAGLLASNICGGLVKVLHGGAAEDT